MRILEQADANAALVAVAAGLLALVLFPAPGGELLALPLGVLAIALGRRALGRRALRRRRHRPAAVLGIGAGWIAVGLASLYLLFRLLALLDVAE